LPASLSQELADARLDQLVIGVHSRLGAGVAQLDGSRRRARRRPHHDGLYVGPLFRARTQQSEAVELTWQLRIDEHDVDTDVFLVEHAHRLVTIRAFYDAVAAIAQIDGERHADERIALHQNHSDWVGTLHSHYKRPTSVRRSGQ
jgi:hypothetical protein